MKKTIAELNETKATTWLEKTTSDNGELITTRQLIERYAVGKQAFVSEYASKKINGTYKKLAHINVEYCFNMRDKTEEWLFKCPKYVFDFCIYADNTDSVTASKL